MVIHDCNLLTPAVDAVAQAHASLRPYVCVYVCVYVKKNESQDCLFSE